jgi:hypothetical protein
MRGTRARREDRSSLRRNGQFNEIDKIPNNAAPLAAGVRNFIGAPHDPDRSVSLVASVGAGVSREQLLNHVWSYGSFPSTRTVDSHTARLRQKIESAPNDPRFLITVHGIGYKFVG